MQETNLKLVQTQIAKEEWRRRLAQVYTAILAWTDPRDLQNELVAENLAGNAATSSQGETPVDPDAHFDSSTESASGADPVNTNSVKEGTAK